MVIGHTRHTDADLSDGGHDPHPLEQSPGVEEPDIVTSHGQDSPASQERETQHHQRGTTTKLARQHSRGHCSEQLTNVAERRNPARLIRTQLIKLFSQLRQEYS